MAEKSERIDVLMDEIRDLVVDTFHGAAKEMLTEVKGEPPKARMEASRQVALVGRPVDMLHAARLRSRKISAARQARIAKAVGEEVAMNDDEPWTAERLERLHAAIERRLGAPGSLELKRLVAERARLEAVGRSLAAGLDGAGSPEAAASGLGDLADAGRAGRG
ncbi:hypothetical protein [Caulobacter flavus]|uniref:hypothetical protein n=1 Tax=Caulobacter flavus TaxID=1679497 RepID=UPI003B82CD34